MLGRLLERRARVSAQFGALVLGLTLTSWGCGSGSTAPDEPDPPVQRNGVLRVTLVEEGPTRDWGGFFLEFAGFSGGEPMGGSTGRMGGLGNPTTFENGLPAGSYTFTTWDVDPFCALSGPSTVTVPPDASASVGFTLDCGPLEVDPAPGRLAVSWAGTFVIAETDATSMKPFLPQTRPNGCGFVGGLSPAQQGLATDAEGISGQASNDPAPCSFLALDWCADGSRIALRSGFLNDNGIYVASGSGDGLTRLDDGTITLDLSSGVSTDRDCSRVAFVTSEVGTPSVRAIPLDGGSPTLIADSASDPAWSPVDDRIAMVRNDELIIRSQDGSTLGLGPGRCPAWSPDGTRVTFAQGAFIRIANADGSGEAEVIAEHPRGAWCPRWSPSGGWIAYQGDTSVGPLSQRDVFLFRVADGYSYRLTWWGGWAEPGVAWVPEGAPPIGPDQTSPAPGRVRARNPAASGPRWFR